MHVEGEFALQDTLLSSKNHMNKVIAITNLVQTKDKTKSNKSSSKLGSEMYICTMY